MFLKKARKTYKGKVYETYALTESYRENGKVKHRHIANLGSLTKEQAQRIKLVLKAKQIEDVFVGHLSDVVAKEHYRFLDVAVLDDIWRQFDLDQYFAELPYAEAMVVNRCLDPKSKIQIQDWTQQTILPRLLRYDFSADSEYSIYRTLDKITDQEVELQKHVYRKCKQLGHTDEKAVFYDITSSYFEGTKCVLAFKGYSRDHRPDRLQITIALVVTPNGYPFYWRVMPGNTQDVTTVEDLLLILKERFGIEECLLVLDRGMVSQNNLEAIAEKKLTYISALDKDEVSGLGLMEAEFQSLVVDERYWRDNLLSLGFNLYDENLVYREHIKGKVRYILAFNRQAYQDQQQNRQERLQKAKSYLAACNNELKHAQKSRNREATARRIENKLRKWNMHKVFVWELEPIAITKKGTGQKIDSFRVVYTINEDKLKQQASLDGIMCFVTNEPTDKLPACQVIRYYRRKSKVEDAFRELKDHLHLRPFFLSREKRVRAHVTICVLGYLLLNALEEKLQQQHYQCSAATALEILGKCLLNRIGFKNSESYAESITEVTTQQLEILRKLGFEYLISKKYLNQLLEHSTK